MDLFGNRAARINDTMGAALDLANRCLHRRQRHSHLRVLPPFPPLLRRTQLFHVSFLPSQYLSLCHAPLRYRKNKDALAS